jgi:hypothetical protein
MKTLNEITLCDLMAEDLDVWMKKETNNFGFNLQIDDENGEVLLDAEGVHPYAADSFADFCRRYLASYDAALNRTQDKHE